MKRLVLLFLILLAPLTLAATTFPAAAGFVNDFANVIDPVSEAQINAIVTAVESNTTAEIAVVTINSTAPLSPFDYRVGLFDAWNVGKADKDNGLLILYAVSENRIEVEVGYGLEGILNDAKVGRILDEYAVPYKTAGNYSEMLLQTTLALSDVIMQNADEVRSGQTGPEDNGEWMFWVVWIFLMFGFPAIAIWRGVRCPKCKAKMKSEKYNASTNEDVFVCPKCGHTLKKKRTSHHAAYIGGIGVGGHSGSGGFGGFGGGGSGGGGAGR